MLEQDFEKLLAAYFEDELDDEGIAMLGKTVREVPAHRRRFQREVRIHTLLRESAMVLHEDNTKVNPAGSAHRWGRVSAVAAAFVILGLVAWFFVGARPSPEKIGYCLHLTGANEITLLRNGKATKIQKDTELRAGDHIQTDGDAQATLELFRVGMVTVNQHSDVVLAGASQRIALEIKRGELLLEAEHRVEGSPPLLIQTPKAEVAVMGTVFGLEVDPVATRVKVHEGRVNFREKSTNRAINVDAGQYCVNGGEALEALEQSALMPDSMLPGTIRLKPTADVCVDGDAILNDGVLKVENKRRVSYIKFEVPPVRKISGAKLRLKQSIDPGMGTLQVWMGRHSSWSDQTKNPGELPDPTHLIGERHGWVKLNKEVEIDLSSTIQKPGSYSILLKLEGIDSNDFWFGSGESDRAPELILHVQPETL